MDKLIKDVYVYVIIIFLFFPLKLKAQQNSSNISNKTVNVSGVKVDLLFPIKKISGTILVLPGWNFSRSDICEKSDFCYLASKKGYILIIPEMQKSIYATQLFEETRNDWRNFPTLKWVTENLIPYCQNEFQILRSGQNNYLFGISTGGRGVAMLSLYTKNIFLAGAAFSGDYNQVTDTSDNLIRGYYGEFKKFPERWKGRDNPLMNAKKIKIPLFLAHGKLDKIVPFEQSLNFFDTINKINPELGHKLELINNAGHNYEFWSSEYNMAFDFFEKHSKK